MSEEYGMRIVEVSIDGMHCERCVHNVEDALNGAEGIEHADISVGQARISFLPQLITLRQIEELIEKEGYVIQRNENKKGWWNRFIDRMIRSNEKTFGTGRIECCTLARNEHPRKKNS